MARPKSDFRLSFSSVCAPEWNTVQLVEAARRFGYDAIEFHTEAGHAHEVQLGMLPADTDRVRAAFESAGLEISCISTPLKFCMPEEDVRAETVEKLKQYIELAARLGAPAVRIAGGIFPSLEPARIVDYVSDALSEALPAEEAATDILIETSGSMGHTAYMREILKQVYSERLGVLWNVAGTRRHFAEVEEAYDQISEKVKLLRVHDMAYEDGRGGVKSVPLGKGFVQHERAIRCLVDDGFKGCLSVRVAKMTPDEALPQYAGELREYIEKVGVVGEEGVVPAVHVGE